MLTGKRVLIVTNQVPGHDLGLQQSGHVRYLGAFIRHFRQLGADVVVVVIRPKIDALFLRADTFDYEIVGPAFRRIGGWLVQPAPRSALRTIAWLAYLRLPKRMQTAIDGLRLAARKMRGFVHTLGQFLDADEVAFVRATIASRAPDYVFYDTIFNSCGSVPCEQQWVITHEVKHQRVASFAAHGVRTQPASFSPQAERAILEQSGNAIAIHWDDGRELARLAPRARVVVVPVTVSDARPPAREHRSDATRCLFVGSGSFHNLHGIQWFLAECWPQLRAAVPHATLDIVGSVCLRLPAAPPGVTYRGVIDDLEGVYGAAAVVIVPLQIGSGLKVKVVEALGHARAIVTTSVGAQGLLHFSPRPFALADSAADFVAQTAELLMSPARREQLGGAAAACARAFGPDVAFAELDAAILGTPVSA